MERTSAALCFWHRMGRSLLRFIRQQPIDLQQDRLGNRLRWTLDQQAVEPQPGPLWGIDRIPCITVSAEFLEQLLHQRLTIGGSQPLMLGRRGTPGRIELDQGSVILKINKWCHETVLATDLRMAPSQAFGCGLSVLVDPSAEAPA